MLSAGESLGPYRIVSALGAGGMGEVYLAEDPRLGRRVAIKVLPPRLLKDPERRRRFLREARAAAAVDHPNIIHIYEVEEDAKGGIYLVMQHVDGRTIRQALQEGKLDLEKSLSIAMEVADALATAHARGIIHRDIKPDNVMLDGGGHARILDFGLARALEAGGAPSPLTEMKTAGPNDTASGAVMGTVAYMSPEQARGNDVDARSDIFSFGVTLYEMVAGRHPFAGKTSIETMDSLLNHEPLPISTVAPEAPPAMEWVLSKMLAKDREERYQSAKELGADLKKLRYSTPGSAVKAPPLRPRAGRGRLAWMVGVVIVAAVFVPLLVWKAGGPAVRPSPPSGATSHGGAASAASPMKIAVLPLQNVRKDPRLDFLGFALADALISKLSYLNSVTVRPSSYVQKYRDAAPDPKQAGADLGVDHLLLGTLLAEGNTLRISVQLVDLKGDSVQWQDLFDAQLDNLLGLQDEIVNRLVNGMKVTLTPTEASRLKSDISNDPEAFDLFLRAKSEPRTAEGTRKAMDLLQGSLKKDSSFAPAWNDFGARQYDLGTYMGGSPEDYNAAQISFQKALELNPDLPEALQNVGIHLVEIGRHEEAYRTFRRRLGANPADAYSHFLLSYLYRYTGLLRESAAEAEKALALDSGNKQFRSGGRTYLYLGEVDRADPFLALDGRSPWSLYNWMEGCIILGDFKKAREYAKRCLKADPEGGLADYTRAALAVMDGSRSAAERIYENSSRSLVPDPEVIFNEAVHFAWIGDFPKALSLLDRAVNGGFFCYEAFESDPRMKDLRSRPGYASIFQEARRKSDAFRAFVAGNP
jgi:eukaryotic-like serine/threonine-protein kinase